MPQDFYPRLTPLGEEILAEAFALGVKHKITKMGVGDGGGRPVLPDEIINGLRGEKRRANLNNLFVDPDNPNQIIAEQVLPANVGGWYIRELGLYDDDDRLIAVANAPESYKPLLSQGAGRDQIVRMIFIVSHTEAVELKLDPSVVLATKQSVERAIEAHRKEAAPHTALTAHLADPDAHPKLDARYAPLSHLADENAHEDIRSEISTLSAGFRARGVVINALTAQTTGYEVNSVGIAAPGAGYRVSDALIIPSSLLDAIVIVTAVDGAGGITALAISKGGNFETDPSGSGFALFGGSGTGATANIAASAAPSTTLADIEDPRQNDTAVVLNDEIHGGMAYDWGFFDYNGDGIANWVPLSRHSAADQSLVGIINQEALDRMLVGQIANFGGSNPPSNVWVPLNGTELLRAERPILWEYAEASGNIIADSVWLENKDQRGHFSFGSAPGKFRAPDLRGEFLRNLDSGRGVDVGRLIGSWQQDAIRNITGHIGYIYASGEWTSSADSAIYYATPKIGSGLQLAEKSASADIQINVSRVVPTAAENRGRNVAFPVFIYAGAPA